MEAVILAGGTGSRLKPYTTVLPKPLMPVGGRPILGFIVEQLKKAGVTKITLAVNYMAEVIMAIMGDGRKYGIEIEYSLEEMPLGTVAPLKLIKNLPENFLVMNGDVLTDLDYLSLFQNHIQCGARLTVAAYKRQQKIDFGVFDFDASSKRVIGFREKPVYNFDVSMGVYVFSRSLLDRVPGAQHYGFDNLVHDMLMDNDPINIYSFSGYWLDIGRPDDYQQANKDIDNLSLDVDNGDKA